MDCIIHFLREHHLPFYHLPLQRARQGARHGNAGRRGTAMPGGAARLAPGLHFSIMQCSFAYIFLCVKICMHFPMGEIEWGRLLGGGGCKKEHHPPRAARGGPAAPLRGSAIGYFTYAYAIFCIISQVHRQTDGTHFVDCITHFARVMRENTHLSCTTHHLFTSHHPALTCLRS